LTRTWTRSEMVDNSPALIISQICSTRFSLQAIVHLPSGMHIKSSTKLKRFFIFRHPDFGVVALMLGRTPNRGKFRGQLLHQPSPAITSHIESSRFEIGIYHSLATWNSFATWPRELLVVVVQSVHCGVALMPPLQDQYIVREPHENA